MATAELATAAAAITLQTFLSPIPEVSTIKMLSTYILVNLAAVAWSLRASISADIPPPPSIAWLNLVFLSTATSWTVIHRLYFSPLASLPGPKRAAVSRLWAANHCRLGRSAAYLEKIHEEYNADIVRVGPNEVSIIDIEAIQKIYKGQYPRGYFYELRASMGERNLNSERDYTHHGEWRRLWEKALSAKELVNYDGRLQHHVEKFLRLLKKSEGRDVNTIKLTERFQVDVIMDVFFSKDSKSQDRGEDTFLSYFVHKHLRIAGVIACLRNVGEILSCLPSAPEAKAFKREIEEIISERRMKEAPQKDFIHHFITSGPAGRQCTHEEVISNAQLAVIGGSDTALVTMNQTLRFLATNPAVQAKLRAELDTISNAGGELTVESTRKLPYLNGVLSEGLRLGNPAPIGVPVKTPPGGLQFGDTYIPGNVEVKVPFRITLTDSRWFPKGDRFIPERWTGEMPELVRDRRAFTPFGYGVHSCVGKQLVTNELKILIAKTVHVFNILPGDQYDEDKFVEGTKEYVGALLPSLYLKFVPRVEGKRASR